MSKSYFHPDPIGQLIGGYFHQDSADLYGPTIGDVMAAYLKDGTLENKIYVANAIKTFISDHPDDLEDLFMNLYGFDVDPTAEGLTCRIFLERLLLLISEHIANSLGRGPI